MNVDFDHKSASKKKKMKVATRPNINLLLVLNLNKSCNFLTPFRITFIVFFTFDINRNFSFHILRNT